METYDMAHMLSSVLTLVKAVCLVYWPHIVSFISGAPCGDRHPLHPAQPLAHWSCLKGWLFSCVIQPQVIRKPQISRKPTPLGIQPMLCGVLVYLLTVLTAVLRVTWFYQTVQAKITSLTPYLPDGSEIYLYVCVGVYIYIHKYAYIPIQMHI